MNLALSARTLGTLLLFPALSFSQQPAAGLPTELKTESSDLATLRSSVRERRCRRRTKIS